MKILFKNVQWDTDGASLKSCGLKKKFEADIDIDKNIDVSELEDILSDWLSDEFGYCHCGFDYQIV